MDNLFNYPVCDAGWIYLFANTDYINDIDTSFVQSILNIHEIPTEVYDFEHGCKDMFLIKVEPGTEDSTGKKIISELPKYFNSYEIRKVRWEKSIEVFKELENEINDTQSLFGEKSFNHIKYNENLDRIINKLNNLKYND